jgi:hypothetical protein
MAPVPAFTAVRLGKPDPAILDAIDGSDVDAIGTDNFHAGLYPIIVHYQSSLLLPPAVATLDRKPPRQRGDQLARFDLSECRSEGEHAVVVSLSNEADPAIAEVTHAIVDDKHQNTLGAIVAQRKSSWGA